MYGGGGMMGNMMYGGGMYGMGNMGMGLGPVSSLNQFLFGVQNVIFSLSQAVQIVGMNTQAVQQLLESVSAMWDHALKSWRENRALLEQADADDESSPEAKQRRRRRRALRWALAAAVTYAGYRAVKKLLTVVFVRRNSSARRRLLEAAPGTDAGMSGYYSPSPTQSLAAPTSSYSGYNNHNQHYYPPAPAPGPYQNAGYASPYGASGYGYNNF